MLSITLLNSVNLVTVYRLDSAENKAYNITIYFLQRMCAAGCGALKTASLGIGCDLVPRLHDSEMHFDHAALESAIEVQKALVQKILQPRP